MRRGRGNEVRSVGGGCYRLTKTFYKISPSLGNLK